MTPTPACPSCGRKVPDCRHCMWPKCPKINFPNTDIDICEAHEIIIASRVQQRNQAKIDAQANAAAEGQINDERKVAGLDQLPNTQLSNQCVYYLKVGDHIKIGTTTNLPRRLAAYPPESEVLGTEAGGPTVEKHRHQQFHAHLAWGREWFTDTQEIRQFIATLPQHYVGEHTMRPGPTRTTPKIRLTGSRGVRVR
jgi:hypothetical protein